MAAIQMRIVTDVPTTGEDDVWDINSGFEFSCFVYDDLPRLIEQNVNHATYEYGPYFAKVTIDHSCKTGDIVFAAHSSKP